MKAKKTLFVLFCTCCILGVLAEYDIDRYDVDTDSAYWRLHVSDSYTYDRMGIQTERGRFSLEAKFCSDAVIGLSRTPGDPDIVFEIIINENDGETKVRNLKGTGQPVLDTHTGTILNCNDYVNIWITWDEGNFKVGVNDEIQTNVILTWTDAAYQDMHAVHLTTRAGKSGDYQFQADVGRLFTATTLASQDFEGQFDLLSYTKTWLRFEVKACTNAEILLKADPVDPGSNSIHIIIGDEDNTKTRIRQGINGATILAAVDSPNIVSCNELRSFWISWMNDFIEVGRGMTLGNDRLVYSNDPRGNKAVKAVAFSSDKGSKATWQFKIVTSEYLTIFTSGEADEIRESNLVVPRGEFYHFSVRACFNAIVQMAMKPADFGRHSYYLLIGVLSNQNTILYKMDTPGTVIQNVSTPNILSCDRISAFFIETKGDTISFGSFDSLGNRVMKLTDTTEGSFYSSHVAVTLSSSDTMTKAEWVLSPTFYSNVEVTTVGDGKTDHMWYDVTASDHVTLLLKACPSATVYVSQYHGIFDFYAYKLEMGIVDNRGDVILKRIDSNPPREAVSHMVIPLSCTDWFAFWIQWKQFQGSLHVTVGDGTTPGNLPFIELVDPMPPGGIGAVSVSTENNIQGQWLHTTIPDNFYWISTKPTKQYMYGFFSAVRPYFSFEVKACSDVYILLHDSRNNTQGTRYEVTLGGGTNLYALIANLNDQSEETKVDIPNLLNCNEPRFFWINWGGDYIMMGGGESFADPIIMHQVPETRNFNYVSVASGDGVSAEFYMAKYNHGAARLQIKDDNEVGRFLQAGLASVSARVLVFGVRSCGGAAVGLYTTPRFHQQDSYELIIGEENNQKTTIKWSGNSAIGKTITTPEIVSCDELRDFWLTWEDQLIEFGKGRLPGADFLMSFDVEQRDIQAVVFTSGPDHASEWELLDHISDVYLTRTMGLSSLASTSVRTGKTEYTFSVAACSDVSLLLEKLPGHNYEIRIQSTSNDGKSAIYKNRNSKFQVDLPALLNCYFPQMYWASWDNRQIRVGRGTMGRNIFLEWTDTENDCFTDQIGAVVMGSLNDVETDWIIPRWAGNLTHFESRDTTKDYSLFQVTTASRQFAIFRVRICDTAYIALSAFTAIYTDSTYEVKLHNGRSEIRDAVSGNEIANRLTNNLLDCTSYKPFWISWDNKQIKVGKGVAVGDTIIMSARINTDFRVNSLAVSTHEGQIGYWEFGNRLVPNLYHVHTTVDGNDYSAMWLSTISTSSVSFYVTACAEAKIALAYAPLHAKRNTYEVELGATGNKESVIRYINHNGDTQELDRFSTPDVLSCTATREFWISWNDLRLIVGTGPVSSKQLFVMGGTMSHSVNAIAVQTGADVAGQWEFLQQDDDYLAFLSHGLHRYVDFSMSVPHREHLVFKVQACKSVYVLLTATFNNAHTDAYEIGIGTNDNSACTIREVTEGEIKVEESCPEVLSCTEYRTFWLSWRRGFVTFGAGPDVYWDHIAEWNDPNGKHIQQVFFDTADGVHGQFEMLTHDGDVYKLRTMKDHSYDFFTMTVWQHDFTFKVSACNDVFVVLADESGTLQYEIVIGAGGNTKTYIRKESMADPVAMADTPDILSCTQKRSFWVAWNEDLIEVGGGTVPHELRIVHWQDDWQYDVKKLTLSSGWEAAGDWEFTAIQGVDVEVTPQTTPKFGDVWRTVLGMDRIVFRVQATSDVYMALCSVPRLPETRCYELQIGVDGNTKTIITRSGEFTETVDTANVLDPNNKRDFWVSWFDDRIMFGTGIHVGEGVLIGKEEPEDWIQINAISVSAVYGVKAQFEFPRQESTDTTSSSSASTSSTSTSSSSTTSSTTPTPRTTTTDAPIDNTDPPPTGLSAGAIVGIIFGGLFGVILLITLFFVVQYRRTGQSPIQFGNYSRFDGPERETDGFGNPTYDLAMGEAGEGAEGAESGDTVGNYGTTGISDENPFGQAAFTK